MSIRDFVFMKILYPLFGEQIDAYLECHRLAQVKSIQITQEGLVKIRVNKSYPLGAYITVFMFGNEIHDPDTDEYLGCLEHVYARGKVIESYPNESKVLLIQQEKEFSVGYLVKADGSQEYATSTMRR